MRRALLEQGGSSSEEAMQGSRFERTETGMTEDEEGPSTADEGVFTVEGATKKLIEEDEEGVIEDVTAGEGEPPGPGGDKKEGSAKRRESKFKTVSRLSGRLASAMSRRGSKTAPYNPADSPTASVIEEQLKDQAPDKATYKSKKEAEEGGEGES